METTHTYEISNNSESDIDDYIRQLSPQEKKVLEIAREHLETSFNIEKSIGYMRWKQNK
tara:strand:+ start:94 stop:270 length:177 start_codon:yes stop_codon:yes gene_type:complete